MKDTKGIRLHEGELNIMELLWSNRELAAKDIARIVKEYIGWEKNTTYTVIKRLIEKGAITREEPGFICRAAISKQKVQQAAADDVIDQFFGGSFSDFLTQYLRYKRLSSAELLEMQRIVNEQKYR